MSKAGERHGYSEKKKGPRGTELAGYVDKVKVEQQIRESAASKGREEAL